MKKMNIILKAKSTFLILFLTGFFSFGSFSQEINPTALKSHISYLSSDDLQGRGTSSEGEKKSAEYIQKQFSSLNLKPKGTDGYFFEFTFKKNPDPHDTNTSNLPLRKGINVAGFLDNNAENTIVIGAHHDHLGLGHDKNSLDANPEDKIHNGADDNASGVAGVIELARYFSSNSKKEKFNFLFLCFSAEELGLIGSKKFCENPTLDLAKVNYMINLDMIGRLNDSTKKLMVYGVGTSPDLVPLLNRQNNNYFTLVKDSSGIGPSDQTSFYLKNIPVLHFFTGQHSDYHKPGDDAEKINIEGEVKVLQLVVRIIEATDDSPKLVFTPTKNELADSTSSFKVTLGIIPDYSFEGEGVRVDGVTENKPAGRAGIKQGDIIISMGEIEIKGMRHYMKALSNFNKGEKIAIKILRDKKELVLNGTF